MTRTGCRSWGAVGGRCSAVINMSSTARWNFRRAQRVEESADGLAWMHRLTVGVEPTQVHVQVSVRKLRTSPMRPVDGQRRLTHSRHAGDRAYDDSGGPVHGFARRATQRRYRRREAVEDGGLAHASGECGDVRRQLLWHSRLV